MRKLSSITPLLLVAFIQSSHAALPTGATLFDVNVPSLYGGPVLGITALHWETSLPQYDYALTYPPLNGSSLPLTYNGVYHSIDPDSRWNFKFDVGYIFPCTGNDLMLSYLSYHQYDVDQVKLDPFTALILPSLSDQWPTCGTVPIGNILLPTRLSLVVEANPNLVKARTIIDHNVLDLACGQSINIGNRTRVKYYGGIRYAGLNNKFNVIYNYNAADVLVEDAEIINASLSADFTETIKQTSNFDGVGPQLGFDIKYAFCWGFGLVGNLSSSILVGDARSHLDEEFTHITIAHILASEILNVEPGATFNSRTAEAFHLEHNDSNRVVPNIDAKVGIDYTYQYCNHHHTKLTIEAGYMASHYFNVIDRISGATIDHPELVPRRVLDEHFDGFYFGIQVKA